jgi:hypothetical protein
MSLFRRQPTPEQAATQHLYEQQAREDQVTDAMYTIEGTLRDLSFESFHPWHAPDATLIKLGGCAIAYSNDRTAELLRANSTFIQRREEVVTADAAQFAIDLTDNAASVLERINQMMPSQVDDLFDEATLISMQAENMLPYWPSLAGYESAEWQNLNPPYATVSFAKSIVLAAGELHEQANAYLNQLTDPRKSLAPLPDEYHSMPQVIGQILQQSSYNTRRAEGLLYDAPAGAVELSDPDAYRLMHDGYVGAMTAYVGVLCPPSLGTEFFPQRLR